MDRRDLLKKGALAAALAPTLGVGPDDLRRIVDIDADSMQEWAPLDPDDLLPCELTRLYFGIRTVALYSPNKIGGYNQRAMYPTNRIAFSLDLTDEGETKTRYEIRPLTIPSGNLKGCSMAAVLSSTRHPTLPSSWWPLKISGPSASTLRLISRVSCASTWKCWGMNSRASLRSRAGMAASQRRGARCVESANPRGRRSGGSPRVPDGCSLGSRYFVPRVPRLT